MPAPESALKGHKVTMSNPSISSKKTALLLILDGWGHREESQHNAIHAANTPTWDRLWANQAHSLITTSGTAVGLPEGQMGNSEVGHMNLGAGRVVYQNLTRIDKDIADGGFFNNSALTATVDKSIATDKALHILGLMSPGGIHSHEDQIIAMIDLAQRRGARKIYLHAFLDGRDTPPRSALKALQRAEAKLVGCGKLASIIGRFYAMDRDNRWDRVQSAYDLLTTGKAAFSYKDASSAIDAAYSRDENDEFVQATSIADSPQESIHIKEGDCVVFMNFRADRAREITRALVEANFDGFQRSHIPKLGDFVMLTEYAADIKTACAYPPNKLENVLGQYLADQGKTQLRIAETEKYAHVTFFFNGGAEAPFALEDRELIASPQVKTYDLQPEMSASEVTDKLVTAINSNKYDAIICNYANGDMVGHTGNFDAAVSAVECLDSCLTRICAAVEANNAELLITADHGNVEKMQDEVSGQAFTSHTNGPVPLVYVGNNKHVSLANGSLCDLAPTLLTLLNMPIPKQMTGKNLLTIG